MALSTYAKDIKFTKQGQGKGSCIQKGREGWVEIIAVNHCIKSPRDTASGQATGKRQHCPIRIRMPYDMALPQFYQALCNNEAIQELTLAFFSPNKLGTAGGQGVEMLTYELKLTNAFVSQVEFEMLNNRNPELTRYENMYVVEMVYQAVQGTWKIGNKVWSDDWLSPVQG
ncbi:MAG: type VI secretion system tube protein Hcp [Polyangiaceae bacterium]|nr:type VI secretion system tube protein Hcp [Polyangiaceae bacterium]